MGRKSTLPEREVFAEVGRRLATEGAVSLQTIVAETGVSVGSLYHRYGSREGLMAHVWLDAARAFQCRFVAALQAGERDAGVRAALTTPRFCRDEPERALVLACCRRAEFLNSGTPRELQDEIQAVNKPGKQALEAFAKERGIPLDACRAAIIGVPLGIVRLYLPKLPVPMSADAYVVEACRSILKERTTAGD